MNILKPQKVSGMWKMTHRMITMKLGIFWHNDSNHNTTDIGNTF